MLRMMLPRVGRLWCCLLLLGACLQTPSLQALVANPDSTDVLVQTRLAAAQAAGEEGVFIAEALNQRLLSTPRACVRNQPDYACSGVLARPMAANHAARFWEHDAEARARGSEVFTYLRRDRQQGPLSGRGGYILMTRMEAASVDKPYEVTARPTPEQVLVSTWDTTRPTNIPIEALYYNATVSNDLFRAQRSQLQWYKATGAWLPILRYQSGAQASFGFDHSEQLYDGYEVAERINLRYTTVSTTCPDGSARYNCQGVWVRTINIADVGKHRPWNPSPNSVRLNGVSFSWFSADASVSRTYHGQGFIMRESSYPVTQPLTVRCGYPRDAGTGNANDPCTFRNRCEALGIRTTAAWFARYGRGLNEPGCAFAADAAAFSTLVNLRNRKTGVDMGVWNEVMIAAWPQNVPAQLPLEAFIYTVSANRVGAQTFQREYVQYTQGKYRPVLYLNAAAPPNRLVTYNLDDQRVE